MLMIINIKLYPSIILNLESKTMFATNIETP